MQQYVPFSGIEVGVTCTVVVVVAVTVFTDTDVSVVVIFWNTVQRKVNQELIELVRPWRCMCLL